MHEVKVAMSAGFCFGVQRAVAMAVSALKENEKPVFSLGPIIHNPQEVKRLEEKGIRMASTLEEIKSGTVIIRSHGAPRGVIDKAVKMGLKVVDATCPLVKRLKERVRELVDKGLKRRSFFPGLCEIAHRDLAVPFFKAVRFQLIQWQWLK